MKCETHYLGDVCTFIDYRGKTPPKTTSGIPLVTAKIVKNGMIQEPQEFIAENYYDEWMRRGIPKKGSVVFTTEAPLGEVARIRTDDKLAFAQRIIVLEPKAKQLSADYLFYALQDRVLKSRIEARSTGTTVIGIKAAELKKVEIDLPSLEEQEKIASILCSLDDKIELNNKANENLERQASILVERYIKSTCNTVLLSDIMRFDNGFAFQSSTYLPAGQYRIITIKNVQDGFIDSSGAAFIDTLPPKMKSCCVLHIGDVLLSLTGNVGRVGIVCEDDLLLNQRVAKFVPVERSLLPFLYFLFRQSDITAKLKSIAKGTAQLNLSPVETLKQRIPYEKETAEAFSQMLLPLYRAIISNNQQNIVLTKLRDSLLPKLMSGEIDVSDIQL